MMQGKKKINDKKTHSPGFGSHNSSGQGTLSHRNILKGQSHRPARKPKDK